MIESDLPLERISADGSNREKFSLIEDSSGVRDQGRSVIQPCGALRGETEFNLSRLRRAMEIFSNEPVSQHEV